MPREFKQNSISKGMNYVVNLCFSNKYVYDQAAAHQ